MANEELMTAFSEALDSLAAGESVEAVLRRHAAFQRELRPMLEAALTAREQARPIHVPAHSQRQDRARFLAAAAERRARPHRAAGAGLLAQLRGWAAANRAWSAGLALALVVVIGGWGLAGLARNSLPGEPLYAVKRTVESAQLWLAGGETRARLESEFEERRRVEVERLLAAGQTGAVRFGGVLEAMHGNEWRVSGIRVAVGAGTVISGTPAIGARVEVEGTTQPPDLVVAARIEVRGELEVTPPPTVEPSLTASPTLAPPTATPTVTFTFTPTVTTPFTPTAAPTVTLAAPLTPTATAMPSTPISPTAPVSEEVRFTGQVQSIGAESWTIAGQVVRVTASTEIRDDPQVGQVVEVRAVRAPDGTLTATRIERASDDGSDDNSGPGDGDDDDDDNSGPGGGGDDGDDHSGPGGDDDDDAGS